MPGCTLAQRVYEHGHERMGGGMLWPITIDSYKAALAMTTPDHTAQPARSPEAAEARTDEASIPPIAAVLTGDLRCASCRYDLRGLSIVHRCPECGLPVQVTVLSVIDPRAAEIQPIRFARLVATGLLLWAGASTLVMVLGWMLAISGFTGGMLSDRGVHGVVMLGSWLLGLAGLGAWAIVSPQPGIPLGNKLRAALGALGYGLLVKLWLDLGPLAAQSPDDSLLNAWTGRVSSQPWRPERLAAWLVMAAVIWLLRGNLRVLAARSLVLRSARVDRQTMLAMIVVLLMAALGDGIGLLSPHLPASMRGLGVLLGEALVAVSAVLFSIGMISVLIDTIRLLPAVLKAPLRLGDVMGDQRRDHIE